MHYSYECDWTSAIGINSTWYLRCLKAKKEIFQVSYVKLYLDRVEKSRLSISLFTSIAFQHSQCCSALPCVGCSVAFMSYGVPPLAMLYSVYFKTLTPLKAAQARWGRRKRSRNAIVELARTVRDTCSPARPCTKNGVETT